MSLKKKFVIFYSICFVFSVYKEKPTNASTKLITAWLGPPLYSRIQPFQIFSPAAFGAYFTAYLAHALCLMCV